MRDKRTVGSILLGLALCVGIWFAVPYNNFALNNSFISDGYLPEIVLLFVSLLVLIVNPLLRRFAPGRAFDGRQLALVTGMLLFAAVLPGNGLLRFFPHCLAYDTELINVSPELAPAVAASDLPAALFPDAIGFGRETPVSSQLVDELEPGNAIPWSAWLPPLLSWGTLIVSFWLLMVGLGLAVFPQWLERERLAFPLLRVYHAILDDPEEGHLFPSVFRKPLFWIGCGTVFLIHSSNGLNIFTEGGFPAFPVSWNLSDLFNTGVWLYAPGFLKSSKIYFLFVGLAYFMPNRFSFSIWFTLLTCGLWIMVSQLYVPQFRPETFYDVSCGALLAITVGVIWLGRNHYGRVLRAALRPRAEGEEARSDALAGRLFLGGGLVMFAWFMWAGAGIGWSLFFVVTAVVIMLMVARIVAETGITYVWIIPLTAARLIGLFPGKWKTVATAFLQEAHYILVNRASAVSAAAITVLALGLKRHATPRESRRLAGLGIGVLVLGLLVCGAVHLHMGYTMASSFDGVNTPITGRGAILMGTNPILDVVAGRESGTRMETFNGILTGIVVAGVLLTLCARFPAWPLHPIGLIFVYSSLAFRLFMSLFVGWALKRMLVMYGGARAYRAALPLFLGLIFGEVIANAVWTLVPVIEMLMGADPSRIPHMVIFQYT